MDKRITQLMIESDYSLEQFTSDEINEVEKQISFKTIEEEVSYYIHCKIRDKELRLTPEEIVRQLYLVKLIDTYNYPKERMELEYSVSLYLASKKCMKWHLKMYATYQLKLLL